MPRIRIDRQDQGHLVVPILGMHRSGTSLLTRMLAALGLDLGEALQPPAGDNPRGFWEHRFFQQVNMRLLSGLECDPDGFAPTATLEHACERAPRYVGPLSAPLGRFVAEHFGGGTWGFKDPRTCITWRFWQAMFAELGITDVRPVIVLRTPEACASSLWRRGDHRRASLLPGNGLPSETETGPSHTETPSEHRASPALLRLYRDYYTLLERHAPKESLWLSHADLVHPDTAQRVLATCCDHLGLSRSGIGPALATVDRTLIQATGTDSGRAKAPAQDGPQRDQRDQGGQRDQEWEAAQALYGRLLQRTQQARSATSSAPQTCSSQTPRQLPASTGIATGPTLDPARVPDCIYVVTPSGYVHSRAFDEFAGALHHGLADLGARVPIVRQPFEVGQRPVVLGPQLLTRQGAPAITLPKGAILMNLEQIHAGSPWCTDAYRALLSRHRVWDYSARNLAALIEWGVPHATLCEPGFHPAMAALDPLPEAARDIDVLFYGTLCPRREAVLGALSDVGLRVTHLFGVYGPTRDGYIRRAKVCLNLHHYGAQVLEVVRLSYLLNNNVCVVSEPDGADRNHPLHEGLWLADYDDLVDTCRRAVADPEARQRQAATGLRTLQRTPMTTSVRQALLA